MGQALCLEPGRVHHYYRGNLKTPSTILFVIPEFHPVLSTFSGFEGDASSLPDAASYMEIEKSCQQNLTIFIFVFPNHPPESLAWVCSSSSEPDDTISAHEFAVRARSW